MYQLNPLRRPTVFWFIFLTAILATPTFAQDRPALETKPLPATAQVSGIDVRLEQVSGSALLTTRTNDKGSFTFGNVAPGTYTLRIGCDVPGQAAPGSAQKCRAEVRIVITEKSTGVVTGTIKKES